MTALLTGAILTGCSTTKRLGEGQVLYTGVKKVEIIPPRERRYPTP